MTKEDLRIKFNTETNIAPVFAHRTPYFQYIEWLENFIINSDAKKTDEENNNCIYITDMKCEIDRHCQIFVKNKLFSQCNYYGYSRTK